MALKVNKNFIRGYADIRSALIRRHSSLHRWAAKRGYPYTTVVGAARGDRAGKKSVKIRAELEAALFR